MLRKLVITVALSVATLATAAPAQAQGFPTGLLFGILIASSDDSGSPLQKEVQNQLANIPLRCLALLESDEAAYRTCRTPSIRSELMLQARSSVDPSYKSPCAHIEEQDETANWLALQEAEIAKLEAEEKKSSWGSKPNELAYLRADRDRYRKFKPMCDVQQHLTWEVAALKTLAEQVKSSQAIAKPAN